MQRQWPRRERLFSRAFDGEGLSRMAGASAHEEIDEPAGRFLRARDEIADIRLAQLGRANQMSAAVS